MLTIAVVEDDPSMLKGLNRLLSAHGFRVQKFTSAEAFLSGIPAASLYAACEGLSEAGVKRNSGIGIFQDLMDARSLFLTANSTTVYVLQCLDLNDGPIVVELARPRGQALSMRHCEHRLDTEHAIVEIFDLRCEAEIRICVDRVRVG